MNINELDSTLRAFIDSLNISDNRVVRHRVSFNMAEIKNPDQLINHFTRALVKAFQEVGKAQFAPGLPQVSFGKELARGADYFVEWIIPSRAADAMIHAELSKLIFKIVNRVDRLELHAETGWSAAVVRAAIMDIRLAISDLSGKVIEYGNLQIEGEADEPKLADPSTPLDAGA